MTLGPTHSLSSWARAALSLLLTLDKLNYPLSLAFSLGNRIFLEKPQSSPERPPHNLCSLASAGPLMQLSDPVCSALVISSFPSSLLLWSLPWRSQQGTNAHTYVTAGRELQVWGKVFLAPVTASQVVVVKGVLAAAWASTIKSKNHPMGSDSRPYASDKEFEGHCFREYSLASLASSPFFFLSMRIRRLLWAKNCARLWEARLKSLIAWNFHVSNSWLLHSTFSG